MARMSNKGQMFLIASVIIVSILVVIKLNISTANASRQLATLKTRMENYLFDNFKEEFNNTMSYSSGYPGNITKNVFVFGNFTEDAMEDHSITFKMFYMGTIANHTTSKLVFTVINMMDDSIDVTVDMNGQQKSKNGLVDYGNWTDELNIDPGTNYMMTLNYGGKSEQIEIKTKKKKDVFTGYPYLVFETEDATHTSETLYVINL